MKKIILPTLLGCMIASTHVHAQDGESGVWDQFGLGVGLSYTINVGKDDRIKSAEVINGKVRITDEENGIPRVVLEGHYFFNADDGFGHGPFIAIQPGDEEIINAAAIGYMIGLRASEASTSWNLGLGIAADPNVQTLGDGLEANKDMPVGETEIRYREQTKYGVMILFSTTW